MDNILTIPEVSRILKISKAKVYAMVAKNEIPYIRLKRNVRIWERDLIRWLEEQTIRQPSFDFDDHP